MIHDSIILIYTFPHFIISHRLSLCPNHTHLIPLFLFSSTPTPPFSPPPLPSLFPPYFQARGDVEILRADREKRNLRRQRQRVRELVLEAEEDSFLDDLQVTTMPSLFFYLFLRFLVFVLTPPPLPPFPLLLSHSFLHTFFGRLTESCG